VDEDGQPLREGEYFVSEFFKNVAYGKSVKQCFAEATALTEAFTSSGSGSVNAPYYDDSLQHPLLDDNWDGVGSNAPSGQQGEDGYTSQSLFIGTSAAFGNDPGDVRVTEVAEEQFMDPGDTSVNIWARVDDSADVRIIWVEVKAPNYDPGDPGEGQQIKMDTFKKPTVDYNNGRYEWNHLGGGTDPADLFSTPGTYQAFYFAKDDTTGHVSPLRQTRIYKAITGNASPAPFSLVSPADGERLLTTLILDWEDTTDPDGDQLTYTVLLSKGDSSFTDPIRKEGLAYSACLVAAEDGLEDLSTYYWKVQAIDQYGAMRESAVRVFHTDNTNPVAGWIHGHVSDFATGEPITGASVNIGASSLTTSDGGYYLGVLAPGVFTATATAGGYNPMSFAQVVVPEGGVISKDFGLVPLDSDSDGDGISDAVENSIDCLDPLDADTDDDGIAIDSDDDGIQDGTELGVTTPVADPDGAGPLKGTDMAVFQPDLDPTSSTDPLDADTDDDGWLDGQEDKNHNGRVDAGEKNPNQFNARALPHVPLLLLDN
jgi:hypothetical protein